MTKIPIDERYDNTKEDGAGSRAANDRVRATGINLIRSPLVWVNPAIVIDLRDRDTITLDPGTAHGSGVAEQGLGRRSV